MLKGILVEKISKVTTKLKITVPWFLKYVINFELHLYKYKQITTHSLTH